MSQESKGGMFPSYETACNLVIWLMRLLSAPAEMILHINIGERYLGVSGLLSLVLMNIYAMFCPPAESALLYLLITIFFFRILIHRVFSIRRRILGGPPLHSRYAGRPLLGFLIPQVSEHAMRWIEPVVLLAIGLGVNMLNKPLGTYILWSGAGLLGITAVRTTIAYNRLLDTLDAQIDQAALAAAVRDRQQKE